MLELVFRNKRLVQLYNCLKFQILFSKMEKVTVPSLLGGINSSNAFKALKALNAVSSIVR